MLLDAEVQAGIVVDRTGRVRGLVTVDQIAEFMRQTAEPGAETMLGDPSLEEAEGADLPADAAG